MSIELSGQNWIRFKRDVLGMKNILGGKEILCKLNNERLLVKMTSKDGIKVNHKYFSRSFEKFTFDPHQSLHENLNISMLLSEKEVAFKLDLNQLWSSLLKIESMDEDLLNETVEIVYVYKTFNVRVKKRCELGENSDNLCFHVRGC